MIKQTSSGPLTVGSTVEREVDLQEGGPVKGEVKEDLGDEVIVAWEDGEATPVLKDNVRGLGARRLGQGDW